MGYTNFPFCSTLLSITTINVINQIKSVCGKWLGIQMPFSKLIIMPDGYCAWDLLWIEFFVLKFLLFILPTKIFCSHQGEFTLTILANNYVNWIRELVDFLKSFTQAKSKDKKFLDYKRKGHNFSKFLTVYWCYP